MTALSSCEAELDAAILGIKHTKGIVEAMADMNPSTQVRQCLRMDNAAAIKSVQHVMTSWRNRHFAIRAAWIRDELATGGVEVSHKPGKELEADALTKVLDRVKLSEMRERLGLAALEPDMPYQ